MVMFTAAERARVEAAIKAVEAGTSAEFVCVAVRASASYMLMPVLLAAVAALLFPAVLWMVAVDLPHAPALQVALFVVLACVLLPRPIAARLSSRSHRDRKARRLAREMFFSLGLAHTRGRTGVLLFASVAEHYVEVVADQAIHALAQDPAWQAVVGRFTTAVRAGRLADGYVAALEELGAILARHAPRAPDDTNEIPDRLVVIG